MKKEKCSLKFALSKFRKAKSWHYFWLKKNKENDLKDGKGWQKGRSRKFLKYDLKFEVKKIRDKLDKHSIFIGSDEILQKFLRKNFYTQNIVIPTEVSESSSERSPHTYV